MSIHIKCLYLYLLDPLVLKRETLRIHNKNNGKTLTQFYPIVPTANNFVARNRLWRKIGK